MNHSKKQKGFILITTLVLLAMLTVLGVAQISINSTQTQVATNSTDSETSFEKTEGALNEGINKMLNNSYSMNSFVSNANGLYVFDQTATPKWKTVNWESSDLVIRSFSGLNGLQANYIIEQLPAVAMNGQNMKRTTRFYRITGRAVGQNGVSSVLLQSILQIQQ
jgi:type IV pilus assembly protein PilX